MRFSEECSKNEDHFQNLIESHCQQDPGHVVQNAANRLNRLRAIDAVQPRPNLRPLAKPDDVNRCQAQEANRRLNQITPARQGEQAIDLDTDGLRARGLFLVSRPQHTTLTLSIKSFSSRSQAKPGNEAVGL